MAVECKWSAAEFDASGMKAFRRTYSRGENYLVTHDVDRSYVKHYGDISVVYISLQELIKKSRVVRVAA